MLVLLSLLNIMQVCSNNISFRWSACTTLVLNQTSSFSLPELEDAATPWLLQDCPGNTTLRMIMPHRFTHPLPAYGRSNLQSHLRDAPAPPFVFDPRECWENPHLACADNNQGPGCRIELRRPFHVASLANRRVSFRGNFHRTVLMVGFCSGQGLQHLIRKVLIVCENNSKRRLIDQVCGGHRQLLLTIFLP